MYNELVVPTISNFFMRIQSTPAEVEREEICEWHIHNELELFLLTSGQRTFYFNDATIVLEKGDFIFINSRIPHKTYAPLGSKGILLQFKTETDNQDGTYRMAMELLGRRNESYLFMRKGTRFHYEMEQCIHKIYREYEEKGPSYDVFIKSYIYEILAHLYRNKVLNNPRELLNLKTIEKLKPALDYIEQHYTSKVRLEQISECLHVDKSYVCRMFKSMMGITFVDYLNYVRICRAQELLLTTQKNISEIAYEVGFSAVAYFIKCYKKYFFCTPFVYRRMTMLDKKYIGEGKLDGKHI